MAESWAMPAENKITFAEMRDMGVRGVLVFCSDYHCSHSIAISADRWPDDARLSDLEPRFICGVCGKRGADVRPDFHWNKQPVVRRRSTCSLLTTHPRVGRLGPSNFHKLAVQLTLAPPQCDR